MRKTFKILQAQACKYCKPSKVKLKEPFWVKSKKKLSILTKEGLITLLEEKKDR